MLVSHVIDYFQVKAQSLVIPIHDSFLVKQSDLKHIFEALIKKPTIKKQGIAFREPQLEALRDRGLSTTATSRRGL